MKSVGSSVVVINKSTPSKMTLSIADRGNDLKKKVSNMMSNHHLLVSELKSQSAKRKISKLQSVVNANDGGSITGAKIASEVSFDQKSVVSRSSRKTSVSRAIESPLRAGANMQLA